MGTCRCGAATYPSGTTTYLHRINLTQSSVIVEQSNSLTCEKTSCMGLLIMHKSYWVLMLGLIQSNVDFYSVSK